MEAGEKSRPRRTSPKLPIRLIVERRWKNFPVELKVPVSALTSDSSQKPAFRPPPRSSTPRKPKRPDDRPLLFIVRLLGRLLTMNNSGLPSNLTMNNSGLSSGRFGFHRQVAWKIAVVHVTRVHEND